MSAPTATLDQIVELLDRVAMPAASDVPPQAGDAIDRVRANPPRTTRVESLRDHGVIQKFRSELIDGLIRVDTANQFLRLLGGILERIPAL
ncbi:MAG: hypothetical protein L6Q92_14915 [Phycisphaerae bacterium]|nr:hypothetical protein [Phycisphaerae bacterium]